MYEAYAYNPESTTRISETATIINGKILLRHIPKPDSIHINGFVETASYNVRPNQFRCHYSYETWYRETDRTIYFNPTHNGTVLNISYIVVGTVMTTDIWNEIKAHLENMAIHGGGSSYSLPIASAQVLGGVKVGDGLAISSDGTLSVTLQAAPSDENHGERVLVHEDPAGIDTSRVWTFQSYYTTYPSDEHGAIVLPYELLDKTVRIYNMNDELLMTIDKGSAPEVVIYGYFDDTYDEGELYEDAWKWYDFARGDKQYDDIGYMNVCDKNDVGYGEPFYVTFDYEIFCARMCYNGENNPTVKIVW